MSRAKRGRTPRQPSPRPKAKRSWVRPASAIALALLAGGAGLWWRFGRAPHDHPAPAPIDPRQTYTEAMTLSQQGHFLEALPLLHAVVESDTSLWQFHHDYATVMLNAVHQGRRHLGHQEFAVRSSLERVELVRWALIELVAAERHARDPRSHAWAIRTRAQALGAWGFPWEALVGYRQMEWADSSWAEMAGRADRVLDEMSHPERGNVRK